MDIIGMIKLCISTLSDAVLMPVQNIGYMVFIIIIYSQYKRTAMLQDYIYGRPKTNIKNLLTTAILAGLVAGIGISIPMTLLGVTFNASMGAEYLLIVSLLLMMLETRFLCFSYSGGLLSLAALIFGFDFVDVTSIMMLVAILHLMEAVLIFIDGHRGAVPVFLQHEDGTITGGFTMQRFWPIPLALILLTGYGTSQTGGVPTPDWWPLVLPAGIDMGRIKDALFQIFPLAAILGYSEFTTAYLPKEKSRNSSLKLLLFGIMLFILAILSSRIYIFKYIAAVFAPAAHELLIERSKKLERKRKSIFAASDRGIKILDTLPGGPAEEMGIKSGDTVLSINNKDVNSNDDVMEIFKEYITYIWVNILDRHGREKTLEYRNYNAGIDSLGVLVVPINTEGLAVVREQKSLGRRLFEKFKKKN